MASAIFDFPVKINRGNFDELNSSNELQGALGFVLDTHSFGTSYLRAFIKTGQSCFGRIPQDSAQAVHAFVSLGGKDKTNLQIVDADEVHETRNAIDVVEVSSEHRNISNDDVELVLFPIKNPDLQAKVKMCALQLSHGNEQPYNVSKFMKAPFTHSKIRSLESLKNEVCEDVQFVLRKGEDNYKSDICSSFAIRTLTSAAFLSSLQPEEIEHIQRLPNANIKDYLKYKYDQVIEREGSIYRIVMNELNLTTKAPMPGRMYDHLKRVTTPIQDVG